MCGLLVHLPLALLLFVSDVFAGVYPNYRAHFDFVAVDNDKNLTTLKASQKWWQTASIYQIYPRSFKDSDGDGVGDLRGITQQLPYLQELGITAAWISPIYTSPMADFGYDVANFTDIDPIFGTMEDFEQLIAAANKLGVKIILDFVPNHSSDECEWFKKSAAGDPDYKDFYVWHPGKIVDGKRVPPTNWLSVFRGGAWQWHEQRQAYYFHQFLAKQPDLNYRNPKVKETMNEVLRFWLRKGVSGFRIDAVPFLFEIAPDASGNQPDEPRNQAVTDPSDYSYLQHIYTTNQPETLDMVYNWRQVLDEFQRRNRSDERIMLTEAYAPIDIVMNYYGNRTVEGAQIPFNFLLIWLTNSSIAHDYANTVNLWLKNMPAGRTANWVIGNHDQKRVGSRLGADRMDMLNMLILTLPGCSVTYMGEEIGMTDVWISWNDTVDPSACNTNPDIYEASSRDPERTPFQWSDEPNAGFSTAKKTWLPIASDYKEVNFKHEVDSLLSHYNIFKNLLELRKTPTLRLGDTEVKAVNGEVLAVKRALLYDYTFITLMNIFDNVETFDLNQVFKGLPKEFVYWIATKQSAEKRKGHIVPSNAISLLPKEAVVLRSVEKLTTTVGYYTYYANEDKKN